LSATRHSELQADAPARDCPAAILARSAVLNGRLNNVPARRRADARELFLALDCRWAVRVSDLSCQCPPLAKLPALTLLKICGLAGPSTWVKQSGALGARKIIEPPSETQLILILLSFD
jgi:hypothetical protein